MLEIELKIKIKDPDKIATYFEKIKKAGFVEKKSSREHDYYYNHPCRNFNETDEALRIRITSDKKQLTYKGPKISLKSKTRIEHEVNISSEKEMKNILEALGFSLVARVYKERKTFVKENMALTVDYLPELGWFSEIEILNPENADFAKLEETAINQLKTIFGENIETIRESYLELLLRAGIYDNYPKENLETL